MRRQILPRKRALRLRTPEILWLAKNASFKSDLVPILRRFFIKYSETHLRYFPWREPGVTKFHALAAETLLIQTRADTVAGLWPEFVRRYPTPGELARESEMRLARFLRPLGFYLQRAHSLRRIAQTLVEQYAGVVPETVEDLLSI